MKYKNAILIGLGTATLYSALSIFYDFVIDKSMKRSIFYYLVFFFIYFFIGYGTAIVSLKNKEKKINRKS